MNNVSEKLKELILNNTDASCSILEFTYVKLYIAYSDSDTYEYTNLEGCLCLVINRKYPCLFLQLYDFINYNKHFEIQLYTNIENGYTIVTDLFHSIEFEGFSLGINFANKITAEKIKNLILCHSIILNANVCLYKLSSFNAIEAKRNRTGNLDLKIEPAASKTIAKFEINNEENNIILVVNGDEYDKTLSKVKITNNNFTEHYKKVKAGLTVRKKNEDIVVKKEERSTQYYVEYNALKRKTELLSLDNLKRNTQLKEPHKSLSIYDEIKLASGKAKPVRTFEKKPLQIIRLSNHPQLQMGLRQMQKNNITREDEDSD
jgi:hypothetical protein